MGAYNNIWKEYPRDDCGSILEKVNCCTCKNHGGRSYLNCPIGNESGESGEDFFCSKHQYLIPTNKEKNRPCQFFDKQLLEYYIRTNRDGLQKAAEKEWKFRWGVEYVNDEENRNEI